MALERARADSLLLGPAATDATEAQRALVVDKRAAAAQRVDEAATQWVGVAAVVAVADLVVVVERLAEVLRDPEVWVSPVALERRDPMALVVAAPVAWRATLWHRPEAPCPMSSTQRSCPCVVVSAAPLVASARCTGLVEPARA